MMIPPIFTANITAGLSKHLLVFHAPTNDEAMLLI